MPGPNYAAMPTTKLTSADADKITDFDEIILTEQFPTHAGGGWYELSDGTRVQGKDDAVAAEAAL